MTRQEMERSTSNEELEPRNQEAHFSAIQKLLHNNKNRHISDINRFVNWESLSGKVLNRIANFSRSILYLLALTLHLTSSLNHHITCEIRMPRQPSVQIPQFLFLVLICSFVFITNYDTTIQYKMYVSTQVLLNGNSIETENECIYSWLISAKVLEQTSMWCVMFHLFFFFY